MNKKIKNQISQNSDSEMYISFTSENIDFNEKMELFNNYKKKKDLLSKPEPEHDININTLQSIRISHSFDNSKNLETLLNILTENQIIKLNDQYEDNIENNMNINNQKEKKFYKVNKEKNKKFINMNNNNNNKNYMNKNKNNNKNLRLIKQKLCPSKENSNSSKNGIYHKLNIEKIFKKKFEENTQLYKIIKKTENIFSNKEKEKTLKSTRNNLNYTKKEDHPILLNTGQIEQDSIELKADNNGEFLFESIYDKTGDFDCDDKNIIVSELEIDLSQNKPGDLIKNSEKKIKLDVRKSESQNQKQKSNYIQKKLYPLKEINLCNNISKNVIKLKKRYNEEKLQKTQNNKLLNVKTSKNQESKQKLNYSNISPYNRMNISIKKKSSSKKKIFHPVLGRNGFKPKCSSKSILNEKYLQKYYRVISKSKTKNRLNTNGDKISKLLNLTILNTNNNSFRKNINNNSNKNLFRLQKIIRKNNSFISKTKPLLNRTNNKISSNLVNPIIKINYIKKMNFKNKIPTKQKIFSINKKNRFSKNSKIKNESNSRLNSNSYQRSKIINNRFRNIDNDNNYYNLNNNSKIIINTIYNSFTNNIYPAPLKTNFSKKSLIINKNLYNLENNLLLINDEYKPKKRYNLIEKKNYGNNSNSNNNINLLTECYFSNNNKVLNNCNKSNYNKKIINLVLMKNKKIGNI